MKKILTALILLSGFTCGTAQSGYVQDPSFEDVYKWSDCNADSSPDEQPGEWNVYKSASHGSKYIGVAMRGSNDRNYPIKNEDVHTQLLAPLVEGHEYTLEIDLALSNEMLETSSINYRTPPFFRIFGSPTGSCEDMEIIASTDRIMNTDWQTFNFNFVSEKTYTAIKFEIYDSPISHSYLLIDNLRITTTLPEKPVLLSGPQGLCPGAKNIIYQVPPIPVADEYVWDYSGTGATITNFGNYIMIDFDVDATSGALTVYAKNEYGTGKTSEEYPIEIYELPETPQDIIGTSNICINKGERSTGFFIPEVKNAIFYEWRFDGRFTRLFEDGSEAILMFANNSTNGILSVKGFNHCGASRDSSYLDISFITCSTMIQIPNAITPNLDGVNDEWVIENLPEGTEIMIFDRQGQIVFKSDSYQNNWQGTDLNDNPLETGTYWYVVKAPDLNTEFKGFIYVKK